MALIDRIRNRQTPVNQLPPLKAIVEVALDGGKLIVGVVTGRYTNVDATKNYVEVTSSDAEYSDVDIVVPAGSPLKILG